VAERDKPKSWVIYGEWPDGCEPPETNTWDREAKIVDTGLLDINGKPIKRWVKGMDPIGFILPKERCT
jgi:hypothetical protein